MGSPVKFLVLQGPNLNLLGQRQPEVYGTETLASVIEKMDLLAREFGVQLVHVQSNLEGELVTHVQNAAKNGFDGAIINAGGYTHTSVALRDALAASELAFVEIHISNLQAREPFRHESLLADLAIGVVMGFGTYGYQLALQGLVSALQTRV